MSQENQDPIKQAFSKVKQDILDLKTQIFTLTNEIQELKRTLNQTGNPVQHTDNQTDKPDTYDRQTDKQTVPQEIEGFYRPNSTISTGNEGVQTDRQTNRQTDTNIQEVRLNLNSNTKLDSIDKVSMILNSLDTLKKDLRIKFKKLTDQEMLVFSTIYQLQEEGHSVDYSILSKKSNLSESSIRDYVQKLIKKEIPVNKIKQNNKKVTLLIPESFKKIATLNTIISLREI